MKHFFVTIVASSFFLLLPFVGSSQESDIQAVSFHYVLQVDKIPTYLDWLTQRVLLPAASLRQEISGEGYGSLYEASGFDPTRPIVGDYLRHYEKEFFFLYIPIADSKRLDSFFLYTAQVSENIRVGDEKAYYNDSLLILDISEMDETPYDLMKIVLNGNKYEYLRSQSVSKGEVLRVVIDSIRTPIDGISEGFIFSPYHLYGYLEQDLLRFDFEYGVSSSHIDFEQRIGKNKIPKKMMKYVDGNDLLAYFALSFDMEKVLEETLKYLSEILGSPEEPNSLFSEVKQRYSDIISMVSLIGGLLLDEQAVGDLVTGNILVTLGEMKTYTVSRSVYHTESFEKERPTYQKTVNVFPVLAMIETKNEKMVREILNQPLWSEQIQAVGDYYRVYLDDFPDLLYVTIKEGIIFITNSEPYINDVLTQVYPKESLSKMDQERIRDHGYSLFLDLCMIEGFSTWLKDFEYFELAAYSLPTKGERRTERLEFRLPSREHLLSILRLLR